MRHHSSIAVRIIFVAVFFLFAITATAQKNKQFKKPITSPRDRIESSNAKWNIGLVGGANLTTWLHFHSLEAANWSLQSYNPLLISSKGNSLGYFGGIAVEYMLRNNLSVGLNIIYAQHNMNLLYIDSHFPYQWDATGDSIKYIQKEKTFSTSYRTIEAYVPISYYMSLGSSKNVRPYVFVAPRVSYRIPDTISQMSHGTLYTTNGIDTISYSCNSVGYNINTFRNLNVGLTLGAGAQFRINLNNYYFLMKLDMSASMYALSTFTAADLLNEFNYLRHSANAHATLTLMLPIKKQLKGACMSWGEYD